LQADISITRSDTRNCGFGNRVQTVHIEPNNAAEYAGFIWREPEVVIVAKDGVNIGLQFDSHRLSGNCPSC